MTLKEKLDEIFDSNNFGNIEIKYGKKESYCINYYTGLMFGEIPDKIYKKDVKAISFTGSVGRVDYSIVVK